MIRPLTLLAASVALITALGCTGLTGTSTEIDEIRAFVHVDSPKRGTLDRTLKLTGTVQAGRVVPLVPEVQGAKVLRLPFKVGEEVKRGQVVATLDIEMAQLQQQQAAAGVRLAELGLATAEREFARADKLHNSGTLTDQAFEQALAGLEMSKVQVEQAKAGRGMANRQVRSGVLTAPFDGRIGAIANEEGEYFTPAAAMATGGGLLTVVDLQTIKIDLQVSDRDVAHLKVGMPAIITIDALEDILPPEGVAGWVDSVGYAADPISRTFPVRVVALNPDHAIRAGTHARVNLVLDRAEDALYVPEKALLESDGKPYVVVVQDEKAKRVPVELGLIGDEGTQVSGELAPEAQVMVRGHFGLNDGARVEVVQ